MSVIKRKIDVPDTIDLYTTATLKTMGNIQEISLSSNRNNGNKSVTVWVQILLKVNFANP